MSFLYDIVVIGGGIVGLGVFNRLLLNGYRKVLLVEKSSQIITGASAGNSGILHTGFDSTSGTLEATLVKRGYDLYQAFAKDVPLPIKKIGAHMVAWDDDELHILKEILHKAHENGVLDAEEISPSTIYEREPNLRPGARGAIFIPGESIVDPLTLPLILYIQAKFYGGHIMTNAEIIDGFYNTEQKYWSLNNDRICTRIVINCAGLYGDIVEQIRFKQIKNSISTSFTIHPRIGQFAVYASSNLTTPVHSILLPIPTKFTKGIIVYPNLFGQLVVGPTAETQIDRQHAPIQTSINDLLEKKINDVIPNLIHSEFKRIGSYVGIRPATEHSDYQIQFDEDLQWICCGGIRSTGLTSSLSIGEYICQQLEKVSKINNQLECLGFSTKLYDESLERIKDVFQLSEHGLQARCFANSSNDIIQSAGALQLDQSTQIEPLKINCADEILEISHWLLQLAWKTRKSLTSS